MKASLVAIGAIACLAPVAVAQQPDHHHMDHAAMMEAGAPQEGGDAAFATIQEIVGMLEADPSTDWSKVDIEALRAHLIDMNNVTLRSVVKMTAVGSQVTFDVSGDGPVRDSIRRMIMAHAAAMDGQAGWRYASALSETGARLVITAPDAGSLEKVRALGFIGVMTLGMHHPQHHLMVARGAKPHG